MWLVGYTGRNMNGAYTLLIDIHLMLFFLSFSFSSFFFCYVSMFVLSYIYMCICGYAWCCTVQHCFRAVYVVECHVYYENIAERYKNIVFFSSAIYMYFILWYGYGVSNAVGKTVEQHSILLRHAVNIYCIRISISTIRRDHTHSWYCSRYVQQYTHSLNCLVLFVIMPCGCVCMP